MIHPPGEHPLRSERREAIALANRVLERPNADPDDDMAILARQFLRSEERCERVPELERELEKRTERVERDGGRLKRLTAALELLREVKTWIGHKRSCPPPASNFQKNKQCKCGKDDLIARIDAIRSGGQRGS